MYSKWPYATKNGKLLNEEELNQLDVMDIERMGIHAVDHWNGWMEDS